MTDSNPSSFGDNGKDDAPHNDSNSSMSRSEPTGMQVSSDEINFLVYRYLQEAGFVHSAFTFAYESMITRSHFSRSNIPPGALIAILQKGLQYIGIEETIRIDGSDSMQKVKDGKTIKGGKSADGEDITFVDFSLLSPHALRALNRKDPPIKINIPTTHRINNIKGDHNSKGPVGEGSITNPKEFRKSSSQKTPSQPNSPGPVKGGTKSLSQSKADEKQTTSNLMASSLSHSNKSQNTKGQHTKEKLNGPSHVSTAKGQELSTASSTQDRSTSTNIESTKSSKKTSLSSSTTSSSGMAPMDLDKNDTDVKVNNPPLPNPVASDSTVSSQDPTIAVNDNNNTSRPQDLVRDIEMEDLTTRAKPDEILVLSKHNSEVFMCAWNPVFTDLIATGSADSSARIWQMGGPDARAGYVSCRLLMHEGTTKNKDVTTLEWGPSGEFLATGSYDGMARVWMRDGTLIHKLSGHKGPIFSLKWNKIGSYLLSGSFDTTTIVWDVSGEKGVVKQQFSFHTAPALDVDWKDDTTFASCSTDKTIQICKIGSERPLHTYISHKDEVNAVKWDPLGRYLASCSDDCSAKIWDISLDSQEPLHDLRSHNQAIYTVKWSPIRQRSNPDEKPLILVTASFDGSVRLWDARSGSCISVLLRHRDSVYSVAFSPSGEYLASGSLAGQLYVWSVKEGKPVRSFKGKGDIFEVAWNAEETRIAACFSSNIVNVIDFHKES